MSWATATLSIQNCKTRIEKIGGSRVETGPTASGLDAQVWNPLWTGEMAMKKGMPILKKAGFKSVEDLPRTAVCFSSKAYQDLPPQLKVGLGILQITSAKRCPQVWPWFGRSLFSTDFVEFDQAV